MSQGKAVRAIISSALPARELGGFVPTWLRQQGYRFGITAGDCAERAHVHVVGREGAAKWWLSSRSLARSHGYNRRQLAEIEEIVADHEAYFDECWQSFCGARDR
jgi:Domain of unknown function (DUF4160)